MADHHDQHPRHVFDYYCVLDFEATCENPNPEGYEHEIIEFPVVLVEAKSLEVKDTIQIYVKPTNKPELSDFCKKLTGIQQKQVDGGVSLPDALDQIHRWLRSHSLVHEDYKNHVNKKRKILSNKGDYKYKFVFVTDGPWDLSRFLHKECQRKSISKARYYDLWVNLRYLFCDYYQIQRSNIEKMLSHYKLEFEGSPHSGLDDSKNIARIAIELAKDGCLLDINDGIRRKSRSRIKPKNRDKQRVKSPSEEKIREEGQSDTRETVERGGEGNNNQKETKQDSVVHALKSHIADIEMRMKHIKKGGGNPNKNKKKKNALYKKLKELRSALDKAEGEIGMSDHQQQEQQEQQQQLESSDLETKMMAPSNQYAILADI